MPYIISLLLTAHMKPSNCLQHLSHLQTSLCTSAARANVMLSESAFVNCRILHGQKQVHSTLIIFHEADAEC